MEGKDRGYGGDGIGDDREGKGEDREEERGSI